MNFVTMQFLAFLIVTVAVFYAFPRAIRWYVLLSASVVFYCSANPYYMIFLFAAILSTYLAAIYMGSKDAALAARIAGEKPDKERKKKLRSETQRAKLTACVLALIATLGVLLVLKYSNFILSIFSRNGSALDFILPLGISFYTFQAVGYCIDVYRGMCEPQRNLLKYALYVMYFPQILQGPIGSYTELEPQLYGDNRVGRAEFASGVFRILWGFFKKLVIADRIAIVVNTLFDGYEAYRGVYVALAAVGYAIQLYADFSGYMDIALGCSELFGIRLRENFQTPYFSRSISEFWRRWHISLGAWFRDYVFYSLEHSRLWRKLNDRVSAIPKKLGRTVPTACALLIVWLLIGFWHGAAWHYVVYGLFHGGMIILALLLEPLISLMTEKLRVQTESSGWKRFCTVRTFALVCVGYLIFRSDNMAQAWAMFQNLFAEFNLKVLFNGSLLELGLEGAEMALLTFAVFALICVDYLNDNGVVVREWLVESDTWFQLLVLFVGFFFVLIFGAYGSGYNAADFIYFKF